MKKTAAWIALLSVLCVLCTQTLAENNYSGEATLQEEDFEMGDSFEEEVFDSEAVFAEEALSDSAESFSDVRTDPLQEETFGMVQEDSFEDFVIQESESTEEAFLPEETFPEEEPAADSFEEEVFKTDEKEKLEAPENVDLIEEPAELEASVSQEIFVEESELAQETTPSKTENAESNQPQETEEKLYAVEFESRDDEQEEVPATQYTLSMLSDAFQSRGAQKYTAVVGQKIRLSAGPLNSAYLQYSTDGGKTWKSFTSYTIPSNNGISGLALADFTVSKNYFNYSFRFKGRNVITNKVQYSGTIKLTDKFKFTTSKENIKRVPSDNWVTFRAKANYVDRFIWQYSTDRGKTWTAIDEYDENYYTEHDINRVYEDYDGTLYGKDSSSILSFTAGTSEFNRIYRCRIIGTSGKSKYATYYLVRQPKSVKRTAYNTVTFSFSAGGAREYQWQYKKDGKWINCTGTNSKKTKYTYMVKPSVSGRVYRCIYRDYKGKWKSSVEVKATTTTKFRALLIGETYPGTSDFVEGCGNDARLMRKMLANLSSGTNYEAKVKVNITKEQIKNSISAAFANATAYDVSLIMLSGHGGKAGTFATVGGGSIWSWELRDWLDEIPGKKIVLLNCCFSGTFINRGEEDADLDACSDAWIEAFSMESRTGELAAQNYYVLTCASKENEGLSVGWPVRQNNQWTYKWSGRMMYHILWGAGLDFYKETKINLRADANKDQMISLREMYNYILNGCKSDGIQAPATMRVYPSNSGQIIFAR